MSRFIGVVEDVGRVTVRAVGAIGYAASLFSESLVWLAAGRSRGQSVQGGSVVAQMMEIGIRAIPIVVAMSATIGVMLAIQGIHTLKSFGAESQVVKGVALSVTREFAPLITGILVAGRSGSAMAARLGIMCQREEIDALKVMGISPVRFLVVPVLLATLVMVPALAFIADLAALGSSGLYVTATLGMDMGAYFDQVTHIVSNDDLVHGLSKSVLFAALIAMVGTANGLRGRGGAEGVGRATTDAVVQSITAIILTDMLFVFAVAQ